MKKDDNDYPGPGHVTICFCFKHARSSSVYFHVFNVLYVKRSTVALAVNRGSKAMRS